MLIEFIEKKTLPCYEIMLLRNFHQISATLISVQTPFSENLPRFILSYHQFPILRQSFQTDIFQGLFEPSSPNLP